MTSRTSSHLVLDENMFIEKMLPAPRNGYRQPTRWQNTGDHSAAYLAGHIALTATLAA